LGAGQKGIGNKSHGRLYIIRAEFEYGIHVSRPTFGGLLESSGAGPPRIGNK